MFEITIPAGENWDENIQEFVPVGKEQTLQLEHSLVSLSKWESKWKKPFLLQKELSYEETIDYIRCMTLNHNVDQKVYSALTVSNINDISEYIQATQTATTINERKRGPKNREIITSEMIYYWMIEYSIPVEFQKWHLSRLITLIRICGIKGQAPEKMSRREAMQNNAQLNAQRRAKLHSRG